jgi:hypothetical protein
VAKKKKNQKWDEAITHKKESEKDRRSEKKMLEKKKEQVLRRHLRGKGSGKKQTKMRGFCSFSFTRSAEESVIFRKKKGGDYMCPHQGEKKNKKNVKRNLAFFFFWFWCFWKPLREKKAEMGGGLCFSQPLKTTLGEHTQAGIKRRKRLSSV